MNSILIFFYLRCFTQTVTKSKIPCFFTISNEKEKIEMDIDRKRRQDKKIGRKCAREKERQNES